MDGGLMHQYRPHWTLRQNWMAREPLPACVAQSGERRPVPEEPGRPAPPLLAANSRQTALATATSRTRVRSSSAGHYDRPVGSPRRQHSADTPHVARRPSLAQTLDSLRQSLRSARSEQQLNLRSEAAERTRPRHVVLRRLSADQSSEMLDTSTLTGDPHDCVHISQADQRGVFAKFFRFHRCYDVMPHSGKLVVLDVEVAADCAYQVLTQSGVRAAPLWDGRRRAMVGMLTMTDLLTMLVQCSGGGAAPGRLSEWRAGCSRPPAPLVCLSPDTDLHAAAVSLLHHRVHRLPVLDPASGDLLHLVTRQRLLRFLRLHLPELPRPALLDTPLHQLPGVGTFSDLELARPETSLLCAARALLRRGVSALPVVDSAGRLVRVCTKAELLSQAAAGGLEQLQQPLSAAGPPGAVVTCRLDDTLGQLLERAGRAQVHRLVAVDYQGRVMGVLSLSDLLRALLDVPQDGDHGRRGDINHRGDGRGRDRRSGSSYKTEH